MLPQVRAPVSLPESLIACFVFDGLAGRNLAQPSLEACSVRDQRRSTLASKDGKKK
jgi:hypothetical protein